MPNSSSKSKLKPFVKWAGGKTQLLEKLEEHIPSSFSRYYEPFIGGGALLLAIQPETAIMNDINGQLLNIYRCLQNNADTVIDMVNRFDAIETDKEHYYQMRERYNEKIKKNELDSECAALMIWINKHCFNGLYRVNSKGLFNVPYNNKKSGKSIDEDNIKKIGQYLKSSVEIREGDFEEACKDATADDFIYFDSPYIPVSKTANFTDYTKDGFTYDDHVRLSKLYRHLSEKGVKMMLSNNNVDLVYELYNGFNIEPVDVRRAINRNASKRKGKEVIITNY